MLVRVTQNSPAHEESLRELRRARIYVKKCTRQKARPKIPADYHSETLIDLYRGEGTAVRGIGGANREIGSRVSRDIAIARVINVACQLNARARTFPDTDRTGCQRSSCLLSPINPPQIASSRRCTSNASRSYLVGGSSDGSRFLRIPEASEVDPRAEYG